MAGAVVATGSPYSRLCRKVTTASSSVGRSGTTGIRLPGLSAWGLAIQPARLPRVFGQRARRDRAAAGQVGQVGTEPSAGQGTAYGVAERACRAGEHSLPRSRIRIRGRGGRLALEVEPLAELPRRLRDDRHRHLRVLRPAVLTALTAIDAGAVGLEPHDVLLARDEIGLAAELGNPEAVDHVARDELEADRLPHRDVNLVRRDRDTARRAVEVVHLPPPLMAGDLHCDRGRSCRSGHGGLGHHGEHEDGGENHRRHDDPADHDPAEPAGGPLGRQ